MALHTERFKDNKDKLQKWRIALQQVANFSGWHFKHGHEYEHNFIEKIVEEVSKKIKRVALYVAAYPVGLEPRVLNVISLLDLGSHDRVHLVGIHGTGGIGKTTLALAVYNSIADHFESLCFLKDVRETSKNHHGLLHLQEILLSNVVGEFKIKLTSVEQGVSTIQRRLQQKKILLILDDVDKEEQLQHIVGRPDLLGPGSRVIITTRNQQLLAYHGVERTYKVKELKKEHATKLFTKNQEVNSTYEDLLNQALSYASGLPLALELISSNLFGKTREEWESTLEQYKRIPPRDIQKILEVSFDALEEEEKNVFLDIACCFKGYKLEEVKDILCAHYGFCIANHIRVLVQKSLITITPYWMKTVTLHDLIEDMGKEIVRQESPKEPGNRSRLWSLEDIFEVLEENTGTSIIEMIHLDNPSLKKVDWDGEAFKEMKKLRTLVIRKTQFSKGPKYLPNSLRVLEWCEYPSQHLPSDFHPKKLSICKLPKSSLVSLRMLSSSKKLETMKVLNLDSCGSLTQIPNLSDLPNLEELSFAGCSKLITIDWSVGLLDKLQILDVAHCSQLRSFPPLKLPSLFNLKLSGCSSLESFPEILQEMKYIEELDLRGTNISKFPHSFGNLTRLGLMWVSHLLSSRSLDTMPQLPALVISQWRIWEEDNESESEEEVMDGGAMALVPTFLNEKESSMLLPSKLQALSLIECDLSVSDGYLVLVPSLFPQLAELVISQWEEDTESESEEEVMDGGAMALVPTFLNEKESSMLFPSKLEYLTLTECHLLSDEYLVLVPSLFPNLKQLDIDHCSITVVPECIKECRFLRRLSLKGCEQLREICEGILPRLSHLYVIKCPSLSSSCRSMLLRQELHEAVDIHLEMRNLEGETIPEWYEHQNRGRSPSLSFWFRNKFPDILLCIASLSPSPNMPDHDYSCEYPSESSSVISSVNGSSGGQQFRVNRGCTLLNRLSKYNFDTLLSERCRISKNEWNHVEFRTEWGFDFGIGIDVLKEQNMQDIRFTNPLDLNLAPLEEDEVSKNLTSLHGKI